MLINYYLNSLNFLNENYNFKLKKLPHGPIEQAKIEWNYFCKYTKNNYKLNYSMEIGSFCGGTLHSLCQIAEDDATIISIDDFSYLNKEIFETIEKRNELFNKFKKPNQKLFLINGNSRNINTINEVKKILGDNKLDYLFIDGDHSYEGVKNDFLNYAPYMKKNNSIIGFHDYKFNGSKKFLNELEEKKYTFYKLDLYSSNLVCLEL